MEMFEKTNLIAFFVVKFVLFLDPFAKQFSTICRSSLLLANFVRKPTPTVQIDAFGTAKYNCVT